MAHRATLAERLTAFGATPWFAASRVAGRPAEGAVPERPTVLAATQRLVVYQIAGRPAVRVVRVVRVVRERLASSTIAG